MTPRRVMLVYLLLAAPLFATQTGVPPYVSNPVAGQVVQRDTTTADIPISGALPEGTWSVEAQFNGGGYSTIATSVSGTFSGTLSAQTVAEGTLNVRLVGTSDVTNIANVALGEVLIVAGQSNASGFVTNNQTYSGTARGSLFSNDYVWEALTDPTDDPDGQLDRISADTSNQGGKGSVWPLLANEIETNLGVAVAIVPSALGGTRISAWQQGSPALHRGHLYGSMAFRASKTGGRVVLWWQGESDALVGMARADYNALLDSLANDIQSDLGLKLMTAKLQNSSSITDANEALINNAIGDAWSDNANVLAGPDLSDLASDDGFHITRDAKAQTVAERWYTALATAFSW